MNRMSWLLVVPLALASALSVPAGCVEFDVYTYNKSSDSGGNGGTGGGMGGSGNGGSAGDGGMSGCTDNGDCADSECRIGGTCNNDMCLYATVHMPGTPIGAQVYGDCKQRECDLSGTITQADAPSDIYDWGNPCYADGCSAWTNPQSTAEPCTTKWGKTGGLCSALKCIECTEDSQCNGMKCATDIGKCVPTHCSNGAADTANGETDMDCGGPCVPCVAGKACTKRTDCEGEGVCMGNVCQVPTCKDTLKTGDETGPDCGGTCAKDMADPKKCPEGVGCLVPDDCQAGLSCKNGSCEK
ncbi:hypothetical protein [Polyangium sp. 6x1]|uniref:hypothetical protein n=1 Tax=Polyangium sp. 6x1 TaxID=3042689 RepID=UPI0024830635|nr:hypothetical protein [Polyangium sp. 6x1]MDI1446699.1 hypothetical protein [Polyangium sp. 6x1]